MLSMSPEYAFQILNLSGRVTPDEIKNAYRIMALKWHPDRYRDLYDKDRARVHFMRATDAYRTLVRAGYIVPLPLFRLLESTASYQSLSMTQTSSTESLATIDSFVHVCASSFEFHSTPTPSKMREPPSFVWTKGRCTSVDTSTSQHYTPGIQPRPSQHDTFLNTEARPTEYKSPSFPSIPHPVQQQVTHTPRCPPTASTSRTDVSSVTLHPSSQPNSPLPLFHPKGMTPSPTSTPPYTIALQSIGLGIGGEWIYSLSLTLEELFFGKRCRFSITRSYLSKKTKKVIIEIEIPAGCRPGTRIVCHQVGHEWRPGTFQDIAFVVEETRHDRFIRLFDDLITEVRLPWAQKQGGNVSFIGIDGTRFAVHIDYPRDKQLKGRNIIKGAGMPIREHGRVVGRGNVVVQWEIVPQKTKILGFIKRIFGRK